LRIDGSELSRGRGIAVGNERGDTQANQKPGTGHARCRSERCEYSSADHRSETDDDGVNETKTPIEPSWLHTFGT
jgi:hypothetical protein